MPVLTTPAHDGNVPKGVIYAIGALSLTVAVFLIWLIYFKGRTAAPDWVSSLPAANAAFNSMSAICLLLGYFRIRRREIVAHKRFMLAATTFSAPLSSKLHYLSLLSR